MTSTAPVSVAPAPAPAPVAAPARPRSGWPGIIALMVALCRPRPEDVICDPACGTAGFPVEAANGCVAITEACCAIPPCATTSTRGCSDARQPASRREGATPPDRFW